MLTVEFCHLVFFPLPPKSGPGESECRAAARNQWKVLLSLCVLFALFDGPESKGGIGLQEH